MKRGKMIKIRAMGADETGRNVLVGIDNSDDGDVLLQVGREADDEGMNTKGPRLDFYIDVGDLLRAMVDVGAVTSFTLAVPIPVKD